MTGILSMAMNIFVLFKQVKKKTCPKTKAISKNLFSEYLLFSELELV
jgi:NADH:ubiquinone oxidoreductase subunit 6 (subunit J)